MYYTGKHRNVSISNEIGLELIIRKLSTLSCLETSMQCKIAHTHTHTHTYIYIYVGNKSFERVEHFRYLVTSLMNQNSVNEEIKCRLQSGYAFYYSVQNIFSSSLLSKNIKVKIYRTIILPFVLYGCETWFLTVS